MAMRNISAEELTKAIRQWHTGEGGYAKYQAVCGRLLSMAALLHSENKAGLPLEATGFVSDPTLLVSKRFPVVAAVGLEPTTLRV